MSTMSRRARTLLVLCVSSIAACFDGDVALVEDDAGQGPARDATASTDRDDASSPRDEAARPPGDGASGDGGSADAAAACASRETCGNGLDDDCNGAFDDGCVCLPGATQRCYEGAAGAAGRGACAFGSARCEGAGEFGRWGRCEGAGAPAAELCDGVDNDCDGLVDEGFCRVGGACARDGEVNPANACQVCVAREGAPGAAAWSPRGATTVCRPSAGPCDVAERCDGVSAACPPDALAGPSTVCRASSSIVACDPAESCNGRDVGCPSDVVTRTPAAEVCGNGADENCNGMVDEGCMPCIAGSASGSPWQMHRRQGPVCFGRTFSQHGDPGEYSFARIPGETEDGWTPVTSATIDFTETSALCGRSCSCLDGGEFTYFQTFFDVTAGYTVTSLGVTMAGVDDGARITVYNSAYPGGVVDSGSYILLGGTSVSTNLARYIVTGRNRVVITHIDDCCTSRSITGVRVVVNGAALTTCP